MPEAVQIVANELENTRRPLEEVVASIQAACPEGTVKVCDDMILLSIGKLPGLESLPQFRWRVILFDDGPILKLVK